MIAGPLSFLRGRRIKPQPRPITYPTFKHVGEIPKGMQIETKTIGFTRNGFEIFCDVEVCGGTKKSRAKDFKQKILSVMNYLRRTPMGTVIADKNFKVVVPEIKNKEEIKLEKKIGGIE